MGNLDRRAGCRHFYLMSAKEIDLVALLVKAVCSSWLIFHQSTRTGPSSCGANTRIGITPALAII